MMLDARGIPGRSQPSVCAVFCALAALGALSLVAYARGSHATYHVTDLGTLGGAFSGASSINNRGQITGSSQVTPGSDVRQSYIWENGVMTALGAPGFDNYSMGINDSGQVTGVYQLAGDSAYYSYLYSGGQFVDLGTFGNSFSHARGINNLGRVVGDSGLPNAQGQRAFLYDSGVLQNLGTLGGNYSIATAVNDRGQVVGLAHRVNDPGGVAFLYENGTMINLGTLGGSYSFAFGINNHGHVVGQADLADGGGLHAFLYMNDEMIDLDPGATRTTVALAINEHGQIVGHLRHYTAPNRAFLYEDGELIDLNDLIPADSGWTLRMAEDVNDLGMIVGYGINPQGLSRGFLLTPIPEPGMFGCVLSAVAVVSLRRRHRESMVGATGI